MQKSHGVRYLDMQTTSETHLSESTFEEILIQVTGNTFHIHPLYFTEHLIDGMDLSVYHNFETSSEVHPTS